MHNTMCCINGTENLYRAFRPASRTGFLRRNTAGDRQRRTGKHYGNREKMLIHHILLSL
jgi:hypothetical protein